MLDWLKRRFLPLAIHDSVLGELRFQAMRDPAKSYWEGRGRFEPARREIEFFVDGDEAGPGESQHQLFRQMQDRYGEMWALASNELAKCIPSWFSQKVPPDPSLMFVLGSLSVPRTESDTMEWEMVFHSTLDSKHIFTVTFRGWRPIGEVTVDG